MENLTIGKTSITPAINFQTNGSMLIKGVSTPGDVHAFFQPAFAWIEDFKYTSPTEANFILEIDYLNTASSKVMVQLISAVNSIKEKGAKVSITWRYDEGDEDMLELGKDLETSSKSEMLFVDVKKN